MGGKQIKNSLLLLLTAFIWGVAFVPQTTGGQLIGPYSFNSLRSLIGSLFLCPVIFMLDRTKFSSGRQPKNKEDRKKLWKAGIACGIALFISTNLQSLALYLGASTGKAGFLTACYILVVPILGLFLHKRCGLNIWISVFIAFIGLYLLCGNADGSFLLKLPDLLLLLCALGFGVQILLVDYFSPMLDGVRLSQIQFFVTGILGFIPMMVSEIGFSIQGLKAWIALFGNASVWTALLYAGILSCGVGYTLQIVGQDGLNPTIASLLMSLESVFSLIAGVIFLHQLMSKNELIGCVLVFVAILLAQIPMPMKTTKRIRKRQKGLS